VEVEHLPDTVCVLVVVTHFVVGTSLVTVTVFAAWAVVERRAAAARVERKGAMSAICEAAGRISVYRISCAVAAAQQHILYTLSQFFPPPYSSLPKIPHRSPLSLSRALAPFP